MANDPVVPGSIRVDSTGGWLTGWLIVQCLLLVATAGVAGAVAWLPTKSLGLSIATTVLPAMSLAVAICKAARDASTKNAAALKEHDLRASNLALQVSNQELRHKVECQDIAIETVVITAAQRLVATDPRRNQDRPSELNEPPAGIASGLRSAARHVVQDRQQSHRALPPPTNAQHLLS